MSGQITRAAGQILYLDAQLSDGEISLPLRIIADLLNGDGTLIKTLELSHTLKGVFIDATETMPDLPTMKVKYYVYEMDGVTLAALYGPAEDNFTLDVGEQGSVDFKRNGFTEIKVSQKENVIVDILSGDTDIKIIQNNNVGIFVFDTDTEIDSDGNNTEIGV